MFMCIFADFFYPCKSLNCLFFFSFGGEESKRTQCQSKRGRHTPKTVRGDGMAEFTLHSSFERVRALQWHTLFNEVGTQSLVFCFPV